MFGIYVFTGLIVAGVLIGVIRRRRSARGSEANTFFQRSSLDKK